MERLACRDGYGVSICIISVSIEVCLNLDIELPHVITLQLLIYPTGERAKDHLVQIGTIVNCVTRINNVVLVVFIIHIRVFPRSAISPPQAVGARARSRVKTRARARARRSLLRYMSVILSISIGARRGARCLRVQFFPIILSQGVAGYYRFFAFFKNVSSV